MIPDFNFLNNIEYCKIIVSDMTGLLLYSHIPSTIIILAISLYVYTHNKSLFARILLSIGIVFSIWTMLNIGIWLTYNQAGALMALWTPIELFSIILFILNFSFIYLFIKKTRIPRWLPVASFIVLSPIIFFALTKFNLTGYDLGQCIAIEYQPLQTYILIVKIIIALLTFGVAIYGYIKNQDPVFRKQIRSLSIGATVFLIAFFIAGYVSEVTGNYSYEFYGLFGMILFVGIITNLIIRFKMFGLKMISSQILVLSLVIFIGSLLFIVSSTRARIITLVTLVLVITLGYLLVRSIKKEIEQRERLEKLSAELSESNTKLEDANEKLKGLDKLKTEFLSLASHQLRSPLTAIKGYASMVLEGDYGKINDKAKEAVDRIFQSSQNLAIVVEDLLNVSKIEQGGMKYEMVPFPLTEIAKQMATDLSITAEKRGLKLSYAGDDEKDCMVNGDKEKLRQVVLNFIDNSIKYTKEGSIDVSVHRKGDKVVFAVKDTGMGMTPEIKATLFQKFARGDGARMNTSGSGLGLYLAKEIVEAHKGRVWVESDGPGKGSTFLMELSRI